MALRARLCFRVPQERLASNVYRGVVNMQLNGVVIGLLSAWLMLLTFSAAAQSSITLVANPLPTLVSEETENARLNQLVEQAQ